MAIPRSAWLFVGVAIAAAVAGFLLGGRWYTAPRDVGAALVGTASPDLRLTDLDGKPRRLSEWAGRPLLLNFWATWCGPCRDELPLLDRLHRQQRPDGLGVVGIALDDADAVRRFIGELGITYPQLIDEVGPADASVALGNDRGVLPYSVLIDASGRVSATRVGAFSESGLEEWVSKPAD